MLLRPSIVTAAGHRMPPRVDHRSSAASGGRATARRSLVLALVTLAGVLLPAPAARAATGQWITTCNYSHSLRDDPIVSPGRAGASHMHDFIGAAAADADATVRGLQAGGTTCVMRGDTSAYWVPALYEGGERVLPTATSKHALFYYRHAGVQASTVLRTIPDGLKIIVGTSNATSISGNDGLRTGRIFWKCGPGSGTHLSSPPSQCSSGVMVISFMFPSCWDGKNLDSPDHKSHMAYPSGGRCPASHPVAIPRLVAYVRYPIGSGPIGTISLASGEHYTAHMDFWNGWRPAALEWLVNNCLNAARDCGVNPSVPA